MSRHPRRRRRRVGPWVLRAAALAVVLAIGVALGQALDDSSAPSGMSHRWFDMKPSCTRFKHSANWLPRGGDAIE